MSEELPIKKLGPYNIVEVVGRGGMGAVFAATHDDTGESAAIKVLSPAMAADETFRERFIAEIESLKTLSHPNIVKLHGYGESDGHLYYAMELVEGTNLAQELQRGRRFTWREVTQIGIDMSRALKHAHDHGVIHRDLKPANLLLDRTDDKVKLTDFGIAKLFGATSQTFGGSVMGTADYMAPEQAAGEPTTPRCDLYSLGCVMYALLAGRPPFQGKNIAEVVHRVRYEQPAPLTKYVNDVPTDLQQIIEELLEKDPEERIRTALSLTHRLRAIQQALSISTTEKDEFTSDEEENTLGSHDKTNRIVNPPPDIAERPTVFLPNNESTATEKAPAEPSKRRKRKKLDHFTRVEMEQGRISDSGRSSEFSSAVPLLLLLLTVIGGLMGGVWYSTIPLSADDLHARIMSAAEDENRIMSASKDINRFIEKFPDEPRVEGVKSLQDRIAIRRLQRNLESRARRRKETGKLSPVEVHVLEAIRLYRQGNLEESIQTLDSIQMMFGDESRETDIGIQRVLGVASRLQAQWAEELNAARDDLLENLKVTAATARELARKHPERARLIWSGMRELYLTKTWALEYVEMAAIELEKLGTPDERVQTDQVLAEEVANHQLDGERTNAN